MADTTGEFRWTCRQRKDFDSQSWSNDVLLDVCRPAVNTESLKRIEAVGFLDNAMESQRRDLQSSGHLRVHYIFTPGDAIVDTVSDAFSVEGLLLWQINFLYVEACQVRHLTHQLPEVLCGVDLIGKQHRLLLVDSCLVGTHLDEQIF